jgi:acyl-CoA synthetase (AMP-forming)/AMP-acid ligase II
VTHPPLTIGELPSRWVVVTVDQIPTLASGKFDRKGLRRMVVGGTLS